MAKKPRLTVVKETSNTSGAPPTLGKAGAAMWTTLMRDYEISNSAGKELLLQACCAKDRIAEIGVIVEREGCLVPTKQGLKENPLLKIELSLQAFVVRTLMRMGLNDEVIRPVGRPATGFGWTGNNDEAS